MKESRGTGRGQATQGYECQFQGCSDTTGGNGEPQQVLGRGGTGSGLALGRCPDLPRVQGGQCIKSIGREKGTGMSGT